MSVRDERRRAGRVTGRLAVPGRLERPERSGAARAAGILLGAAADAVFADPRRGHPVAGFGAYALALENRLYAPSRPRGALFAALAVAAPVAGAAVAERAARGRPLLQLGVTAVATWACLGGTSLAREGALMERALAAGDLAAARERLSHLCARDPSGLQAPELARATVESLAENSSDATVAPLVWAAVAGAPGVVAYRVVNTLDAMVGYRSRRYEQFGWASARLDDAANLVPARLTAGLTVALAPLVGGSRGATWATLRRDGAHHPSPNAGPVEAAAAGALGVRLGGANVYAGEQEQRPVLGGDGRSPQVADIPRAVRLGRAVSLSAVAVAAATALALGRRRRSCGVR
ncbi:cobalamin biosynthesis protein [Spongisporangium articulatum]|uniref:Cobalamin biosynthesis protein CobD n=1 Tax=Spongisporangium articulatum TaxID=3362603 RepID=A0ABW8AMG8_9ACTN